MEAMKYVELAVSKDDLRYNLTSVYRDTKHLVATDGHRLHMSNGLAEVKPHYLNGLDATFPDYNQVLPTTKEAGKVEYIHIGSDGRAILKTLKAIAALVKMYDRAHVCTKWLFEDNKPVKIAFKSEYTTIEYTIEAFHYSGKPLTIALNLQYMIDALCYIADTSCEIKVWSELNVVRIDSVGLPQQLTAIVMPQRL